jgi:hypothetical protein
MDSAKVGVLKEAHKESFSGLLESNNGRALESQVGSEVLGDLSHKSLEGKLADEELSGLLVSSNLTMSHSARTVSVVRHHTSARRDRFAGHGGQLLAWGLASRGFTSCLLGTSH